MRTYWNSRRPIRLPIDRSFYYWGTITKVFFGDSVIIDYNNLIHLKIK